jgi:hypothetical protein
MIDSYNFGNMVINGTKYSADLVIFGSNIEPNWWRQKGHEVCVEDIWQYIDEFNPATMVIGTGKFGLVKILPETEEYFKIKNITYIAQQTGDAYLTYNRLAQSKKVMGAFHLTC